MKKKLLAVLLACVTVFSLAGCGAAESGDASGSASGDSNVAVDESGNPIKPEYDAMDYVKLGKYMGVNITVTRYEATQDEFDDYLDNILESQKEYPESSKTDVESGDRVNIDYTGTIDGEEFDGGSAEDQELVIGSGTYIDGFEDQLIGSKVGDTVTVDVTFPDDYSNTDYAGKDAQFEVTINSILEEDPVTPEYTDDFVNEYTNGQYTTTDDFDAYIWSILQQQADSQTEQDLNNKLQEAVIDSCKVTGTPDGLEAYYEAYYKNQIEQSATQYGMTYEDYIQQAGYEDEDAMMEELSKEIEDTVIPNNLVVEAIIEKEDIQADENAIDEFMTAYAENYGFSDVDSMLSAYGFSSVDEFEQEVGQEDFENAVKQYKLWDILRDAANISYVDESGNATESGSASGTAAQE